MLLLRYETHRNQ